MLAHHVDMLFIDEIGRQHAGRIARMNPGVLDVLHHSTDHDTVSIRNRVYVGLECILEKAIDQHRLVL